MEVTVRQTNSGHVDPCSQTQNQQESEEVTVMLKKTVAMLMVPLSAALIAGCDVDVQEEGELPAVDVEPGEMPDVDVRGPDVDVGTETETIEVPDVDVDVPGENEAEVDASTEPETE